MTTMTDEKLIEESYALALCKGKCYETLRKRRYRAMDAAERQVTIDHWWKPKYQWTVPSAQRYLGFAFLVGVYDVEKYMWDRGFAMTTKSVERLEQSYLWNISIAEAFGRNYLLSQGITYLDGVRTALDTQDWENSMDVELC